MKSTRAPFSSPAAAAVRDTGPASARSREVAMCTFSDTPISRQRLIAELPSPGLLRWTPRCKLGVLNALEHGLLTLEEACRRFGLTPGEIEEWRGGFRRFGRAGLKTTTLQERRRIERRHAE
jgi:Protein of unknown function (DUF1153)